MTGRSLQSVAPERTLPNLALLTALSVLFFLPVFLHPTQMFWASDIVRAHAEYRQVQWRSFHVWGEFPLWDPTIFGGKSIVGDPLPALLNPLGMLFWLVWWPGLFGFYLWATTTLSAWGMFFYARIKGCTAPGALLAAVVFAFAGKTAAHAFAGHVELLSTALGLPWLLWGTERLLQRPQITRAALLGCLLALVATCGSVQMVYWHILFLIVYAFVMTNAVSPRAWLRRAVVNELWLGAALATFAAVGAAWWFPIVRQTLMLGARTRDIDPRFSMWFSLPPSDLLRNVWPFLGMPVPRAFAGDAEMRFFWETTGYPGVAAVALALTALVVLWRRRDVWRIAALAVLAVMLAMGGHTSLYGYMYDTIPGFNLFRAPGRMLFYANVLVALLAGMLVGRKDEEKPPFPLFLMPVVLWPPVFVVTVAMIFLGTAPERGLWVPLLVLSALCVLSLARVAAHMDRRLWQYGCLLLATLELLYAWYPHINTVDAARALPERGAAAFLAKQLEEGRFRYYDPTGLIQQQDAAHYGLEALDGYHPGIYAHQFDLYKRIWREDKSRHSDLQSHALSEAACPTILDILNVRYVLSTTPVSASDVKEIYRTPPSEAKPVRYVYERLGALPRAWLVARADRPPAGTAVAEALCQLNPREACLVPDRPVAGTAAYRELKPARWTPNQLTLRFRCEGSGVAVVSQSWHPDWRASDNGRPVELRRVNLGLLGIPIGAGEHELQVYYYPWDFYTGAAVSAAALLAVLALGLHARRKARLEIKERQ
jgi:hypothetical protein